MRRSCYPTSKLQYLINSISYLYQLIFGGLYRKSRPITILAIFVNQSVVYNQISLPRLSGVKMRTVSVTKKNHCSIFFSDPPEGVSCTAVNTSWVVTVSCVIGSVFSSRGVYTCQLYQEKHGVSDVCDVKTNVYA